MRRPKSLFRQRARKGTHRVDQYDPHDPRFVALHEAGHAVSAVVLSLPLESVDIKRRRLTDGTDCVGFTAVKLRIEEIAGKGEEVARPWLIQQLTGAIAESLLNERIAEYDGDRDDIRALHRIAALAICGRVEADGRIVVDPAEIDRNRGRLNVAVKDAYQAATDLVCAHLTALVEVANQLLRRKYLPGGDVAAIVHASIAPEPPDSLSAAREAARRIGCRYGAA